MEGETTMDGGGHRSRKKWRTTKTILDSQRQFLPIGFSVLLDLSVFYIPIINEDMKCVGSDTNWLSYLSTSSSIAVYDDKGELRPMNKWAVSFTYDENDNKHLGDDAWPYLEHFGTFLLFNKRRFLLGRCKPSTFDNHNNVFRNIRFLYGRACNVRFSQLIFHFHYQ